MNGKQDQSLRELAVEDRKYKLTEDEHEEARRREHRNALKRQLKRQRREQKENQS